MKQNNEAKMIREILRHCVSVVALIIEAMVVGIFLIDTALGSYEPSKGNITVGIALACAVVAIWDVWRNWK